MPLRRKIAVSLVFLLGAFTIGISAARIGFFVQVGKLEGTDPDITCKCRACLYQVLKHLWRAATLTKASLCSLHRTHHILDPARVRHRRHLRLPACLTRTFQRSIPGACPQELGQQNLPAQRTRQVQ